MELGILHDGHVLPTSAEACRVGGAMRSIAGNISNRGSAQMFRIPEHLCGLSHSGRDRACVIVVAKRRKL